jgi:hypothetical protein
LLINLLIIDSIFSVFILIEIGFRDEIYFDFNFRLCIISISLDFIVIIGDLVFFRGHFVI